MANTFLAPAPRGVAALVPVSDDKTQIILLILMRGALSTQTSQTKWLQAKLRDFFSFPPSQLIIAVLQVREHTIQVGKHWEGFAREDWHFTQKVEWNGRNQAGT